MLDRYIPCAAEMRGCLDPEACTSRGCLREAAADLDDQQYDRTAALLRILAEAAEHE